MPKGKHDKRKYSKDPKLKIFFFPNDQRKQPEWVRNFNELLMLITKHISKIVNYNHVITSIPQTPLPLKLQGKEYDLSYLAPDGTICLIKFKVIPPKAQKNTLFDGGRERPLSHPPIRPPSFYTRRGEVSPLTAFAYPPSLNGMHLHEEGDEKNG
jgi:hypothetical protein